MSSQSGVPPRGLLLLSSPAVMVEACCDWESTAVRRKPSLKMVKARQGWGDSGRCRPLLAPCPSPLWGERVALKALRLYGGRRAPRNLLAPSLCYHIVGSCAPPLREAGYSHIHLTIVQFNIRLNKLELGTMGRLSFMTWPYAGLSSSVALVRRVIYICRPR
jgi:hypothetical protein